MGQIETLLSLFLVVFIGFLAGRLKLIDSSAAKIFMRFVFYIAIPIAVFLDFSTSDKELLASYPKFIIVNTAILVGLCLLLFLVLRYFRVNRQSSGSILFTSLDGNVMYFGLPILLSVYSKEHFTLGVVHSIVAVTILEVFGFFLLNVMKHNKKFNILGEIVALFKNPIVIGGIAGLILLLLGVNLEEIHPSINNSFVTLSKTTTGLALFTLGLYLSQNIRVKNLKFVLFASANKLILLPLIVYFIVFYLIKLDPVAAQTSVVQAAMPSAVFTLAVSEMYDLDREQTSSTIMVSSILFLLTSALILALPKM